MSSFGWRDNGLTHVFYNSETGRILAEVIVNINRSHFAVYINDNKQGYFIDVDAAKKFVHEYFKC